MSAALSNDAATQLQTLYAEMQPRSLYPLWEVLGALVTPKPRSSAQVHRWSYTDARDYLLRAGDLISAEQAERRVLIMENPRPAGIVLRHDKSLRRIAVDLAGRNRPLPPPRPKRAALRDGGRRRFHRS